MYVPRLLTVVTLFETACSMSMPVFSMCLPRVKVRSSLHVQYLMLLTDGSVVSLPRRDRPPTSIAPMNAASGKNDSGWARLLPGCCSQISVLAEKRAELRNVGLNVRVCSAVKNSFFDRALVKKSGKPVVPMTPVET